MQERDWTGVLAQLTGLPWKIATAHKPWTVGRLAILSLPLDFFKQSFVHSGPDYLGEM
jgi:hypothetical protein